MSKRSADKSEVSPGPEPKRRSLSEVLTAPKALNPAERLGAKVYSSQEIMEVDGMAKAYRQFWNTKASEICADAAALKHLGSKRKAIEGAITTSWVMKKVELLCIQADELRIRYQHVYGENADRKLVTVEKNIERMQQTNFAVNNMYEQAATGDLNASAMKRLETQMSKAMSELKKAQESLRKALACKKENLEKFKREDLEKSSSAHTPIIPELTTEEENTLLQGVLHDDAPGSPEIPLQGTLP